MGYRSDVIFGVRKKHEKKLEKVLEKHDMLKWIDSIERNHEYQEDGKWIKDVWIVYSGRDMKWYDNYDDVKDITNLVGDCYGDWEENEDEDGFMVAMGEDGDIHSEIGNYWEYVDVIRKIEVI
jgi:hypothetical protein